LHIKDTQIETDSYDRFKPNVKTGLGEMMCLKNKMGTKNIIEVKCFHLLGKNK